MKRACTIIFLMTFTISLFGQLPEPALPDTDSVLDCWPDTTGYMVYTVGIMGDYSDLQEAINDAMPGTILSLAAGEEFEGSFTLPEKPQSDQWIIIASNRLDLLPDEGRRIDPSAATGDVSHPTQSAAMPKIITSHPGGLPCFRALARSHHYRLVGLEITAHESVLQSYGLVFLGTSGSQQSTYDQVPDHLIIDRCYIHGHAEGSIMKFGVRLNCSNGAIIDSYISDFHSIGFDAQAISGTNGPGPFKIINNYLEGAGENILFGGGATTIPGLIPSDIEIRQNFFYKPLSWWILHPTYEGKHWTIKNLFELKTGKRVLLDGNILENSWSDLPVGQSGYAILLTVRTENNGSPQADVSDVTITNNIVRNAGSGITLSGTDNGNGVVSKRIRIYNNLFENINGPLYGDQNIAGPNDGTFIKIGEPQNVIIDHNTIFQSGPITWAYKVNTGFAFTNNITQSYISSGGYQGIYGPGYQQGNQTMAHYFPDITDANQRMHKNVFIGGDESKYTNFNTISQNYFVSEQEVGFIDLAQGHADFTKYGLGSNSQFLAAASDGKDIGINVGEIYEAFERDRGCGTNTRINELLLSQKVTISNPSHEYLVVHNSGSLATCQLIDIRGQIITGGSLPPGTTSLDVAGLPNGIYIFHILFEKGVVNRKVYISGGP